MEGIHGIDVSWLHHSNRDHHRSSHATSSPDVPRDVRTPTASPVVLPPQQEDAPPTSTPPKPTPVATNNPSPLPASPSTPTPKAATKRPTLLGRTTSEKGSTQGTNDASPRSTSRRNSWISSISSKFSSSQPAPATANGQNQKGQTNGAQTASAPQQAKPAGTTPPAVANSMTRKERMEGTEPYVPQPPKPASSSFLSSALRRLSSSSQLTASGKVIPNGGMCPRKVMNIDPHRERCLVPELDQAKLRRVAFCVDVEIAGGPRYNDEPDACEKKKKSKDRKLKERGEGEALKHPEAVAEEKDKSGIVQVSGEEVGSENAPNPEGAIIDDEKKEPSRKKEKKKRSEEERKERKEKKRKKAEESGSVPLEVTRENSDDSVSVGTPPEPAPAPAPAKPQDRPTTDPLRIYRRCCQLRETPILKRISEQLAAPNNCPAATPGIVTTLDLTGSRLQLPDVVTLGDWLAVVPVKKLLMEDADLTDEGVRVVLAGLLAAKPPDHSKRRGRSSTNESARKTEERAGVVEKLSLKNNPKITREGWKHISLFLNMCRSIKAIDVSMIAIPSQPVPASPDGATPASPSSQDVVETLSKSIAERLAGSHLEELIMAECGLTAQDIRKVVDAVTISGLKRLGLAGNHIDDEGLKHIVRYVRSDVCQGLDLGGNDLRDRLGLLCEAFHERCPLWALSLADCNLTPESLKPLFPALVKLPNLRFIDLSHNRALFSSQPSALVLLRKYIPQLKLLKRIHLVDVSMSAAQAIGLAEVLPESPHLAHLNILENPQLTALASAKDEASQEEACALYASLMAAARVSDSIICIDVDVPSQDNSEIVKALAKQVVAYCLRNMEKWTAVEAPEVAEAVSSSLEPHQRAPKDVEVPEVLLHIVGHVEGCQENHDDDDPAPDDDYIVGGTGVVKALSYCLSEKASDLRRTSLAASGTSTPIGQFRASGAGTARAKNMSKNLLDSARKIRTRLQPALAREASAANDMAYRRLLFLDNTLQGMIQRFEDEYPECRLPRPEHTTTGGTSDATLSLPNSPLSGTSTLPSDLASSPPTVDSLTNSLTLGEYSDDESAIRPTTLRSRHNSDVSLASRALSLEEGRIHRLGQSVRREILRPQTLDHAHGTTGAEPAEPEYLRVLRQKLEGLDGDEIRDCVRRDGWEETMRQVGANAEELRRLEMEHPEEWRGFKEAQAAAQVNAGRGGLGV